MRNILIACLLIGLSSAALQCLNQAGQPVNWWLSIKYPNSMTNASPRFAYIDSNSASGAWTITSTLLDADNTCLTRTINAINGLAKANKNVVIFNDQKPTGQMDSNGAHAKGIIGWDSSSKTGVYIMHSAPNYPSVSTSNVINHDIPDSASFGQHFYCSNLNSVNFETVFQHIQIIKPFMYLQLGVFANLAYTKTDYLIHNWAAGNGDTVYMFSKGPSYQKFLFEDVIQPYLGANMMVESWGRPYQAAACPPLYKQTNLNIQTIAFPNGDGWKNTQDHSKWGITTGKTKVACLCDINRMNSQAKRGGSCLCSNNKSLYAALSTLPKSNDTC